MTAVGTAGLRIARNSDAFVEAVRERTGIEVEIISGDEEARLAYRRGDAGMRLGTGSLVLFDTGGGSSQFTFGAGRAGRGAVQRRRRRRAVHGALRARRSRLGGHRCARRWMRSPPISIVSTDARRRTSSSESAARSRTWPRSSTGSSTTTRTSSAGRSSTAPRSTGRSSSTARAPRTSGAQIVGLQPKRAEVILAGACIVRTVLEKLGRDSLTVSDRGLRHGLLESRAAGGRPA